MDVTAMQLGTEAEREIFIFAIEAGVVLGVIYDLLAIVRRTVSLRAVTFVCDLVYSLMFGSVFFVFSLEQTGYLRFFVFCAMVIGTVIWHFTLGRAAVWAVCRLLGLFCDKILLPTIGGIHKIVMFIVGLFVKNNTNFEN
jgi:hypothetical protein